MKKVLFTRKGLILVAQIVAALMLVSVFLLSQIGAFAGPDKSSPVSSSEPQEASPTMLTATKTPEVATPVEEPVPAVGGDSFNGNPGGGMSAAYQECQAFHRSSIEGMQAASQQSNQLMNQINNLRNAASASTDQAEAMNLYAQADALQPELDRVNNLNTQLSNQLFQGHHSFGCGQDGPIRGD